MDVGFNVSGLEEINRLLTALPDKAAKRALDAGLRAGGNIIRKEAISRAPVLKGKPRIVMYRGKKRIIVPGFLKKSISVNSEGIQKNGVLFKVKVLKKAFYAHWLEWGTSKMPAQPFMRPALEVKSAEAIDKMRKITGRAIEREAARLASLFGTKKKKRKNRRIKT